MKRIKFTIRRSIGQFLLCTLVLNSLIAFTGKLSPVNAQQCRVIVVNADQPNLWTLEQAQYLLAQMHRRNLDLRAKGLEELDPNEIAGLRFDVMRMLVEFGATFNQADLVSNPLLTANQSFNAKRRQQLLTERDGLRRESVKLAGEIEALETEKASTEDKDAQKVLDAKIAAKTNRLARVDKEIETLKGKRIVVAISGKNFSPQIGALINGVPLVHSIGLAQPLIRDDSATGRATAEDLKTAEIVGFIERIDSNKVLLSFKMPSDFQGTPTITLIAPGRATDINILPHVRVNDVLDTSLGDYPRKMFGHGPGPDPFRIDKIRVFRSRTAGRLTAEVSGAGFGNSAAAVPRVFVNGTEETSPTWVSPTRLTVEFPIIADETIRVTMVSTNSQRETAESDSIANPAFLSISDVEVITYEAAPEDEPNATLVVKITGNGFSDNLRASVGGKALEVAVKSATEAILTIPDPKAASIVTLEDAVTKQKVKVVVTRKSKPPPK